MIQSLKDRFNKLPPDKRRTAKIALWASAAVLVLSAVVLITDDSGSKPKKKKGKEDDVSNVLMTTTGREMGLAGVSNDVQGVAAKAAALEARLAKLESGQSNPARGTEPTAPANPDEALDNLSAQIGKEQSRIGPPGTVFNSERPRAPAELRLPQASTPAQPAPQYIQPPSPQPVAPAQPLSAPVIKSESEQITAVSQTRAKFKNVYIPTGSIMTGVMLTGLDAPTGRMAQTTPLPVVIRVKHEAILPSRYRSDVQEAFILAAGFGDLSSERAYLRAERFSMILRNGEVIDIPIKMSAVGNDGKSGLRGRVVSKQGAIIGQALLAGMADGVSRAFGHTNSFNTGNNDLPNSDEVIVGGIGGGTTGALDRIAQYFLSQAEAMYPVIEVDAGREVSLVLLEGLDLAPRVPEQPQEQSAPAAKTPSQAVAQK